MRLFIALELESEVRDRLRLTQDELRRGVDSRWVRWVRPEGIHLTLKFLGEVEAAKVVGISSALEAQAVRHGPCRFRLTGVGAFPNSERARVLWVGLEDAAGCLAALHKGVEEALAGEGFEREGRAFTPHLTLGRVRDGVGGEALARLAHAIRTFPALEPMDASSSSVLLVRSELRPEGALYTSLSNHTLRGDSE